MEHLARDRSRTTHGLMGEAIKQYVEREERRDRFYHDTGNAWTHHEDTGLHLTAEEIDAWLARIEAVY